MNIELKPKASTETLFRIDSVKSFINVCCVLYGFVSGRRRVHLELMGENRYKIALERKKYFAMLDDYLGSAAGSGQTKSELHSEMKRKYLLPILCQQPENEKLADMVVRIAAQDDCIEQITDLLSVADGKVKKHSIIKQFVNDVAADLQARY